MDWFKHVEIQYSWRKSLSLQVTPDLKVTVKAPKLLPKKQILEWVIQKRPWIEKKLAYYQSFPEREIQKKYVQGEEHYFQGKRYPLHIEIGKKNLITLSEDFFHLIVKQNDPILIEKLLDRWYRDQAWDVFSDVLETQFERFSEYNLSFPELKIRKMKSRWGSCSRKGIITLNLKLIQTPSECLRYVVVHELCHLIEHNHSRDFYTLQTKFFPHWKETKKALVPFHLMGD